ncbi:hypothetical protein MKK70_08125 [Methylobacterium sp. E-041]|jgi:hypothetical protein|uniref:hypothetical protein n=1 Tax=unclassified Methylobacterium TaxID=2615210 RepID=UPI0011CBB74B|nr:MULTISPECIES: hypothetical protein [unclassified Methylobacterium]MCJ2007617.1 hypothetical protein [Methylobacterium sp. J-092]MCJ2037601.1 hypothetical protein [Methylobacterium sp. J-059]MCJ2078404.1 hypothetical protein [Methylobacterium sp. E-016]MCJ2105350.1 hypothetical protein [Methylobacterium sp. E-041]MCJ2112444.1 hypothetical protein [Methylobacterium sp. E-025]
MTRIVASALFAAVLALPVAARAGEGGGGDRQPAGGGHMSSYVNDPYHDPRSAHSQRNRTGQLLGAPMYSDMPGATVARRDVVSPHWASGSAAPRGRR